MTTQSTLNHFTKKLERSGIATARLDCLVLLEDVLNTNRTQILARPERLITDAELNKLSDLVQKRVQHIPLAYLRGKTEFYGREFIVNENVLEPRPESETMIDMVKSLELPAGTRVADVGSGSGALGITVGLEIPQTHLTLIDIESGALAVSNRNALLHNVVILAVQNDLLAGLHEDFDVLICNLPYVPDDFHINTAASHEPAIAIFGGPDGLDLYRRLFSQLSNQKDKPGYILTESLPPQHEALNAIAQSAGFAMTKETDFIQLFQPV